MCISDSRTVIVYSHKIMYFGLKHYTVSQCTLGSLMFKFYSLQVLRRNTVVKLKLYLQVDALLK